MTLLDANGIGFLVARNPYERFVSAYRDRILGVCESNPTYRNNNIIIAKYRNISLPSNATSCPTFKEFVSHVLDEFHAGHALNIHLAPVYSLCNPCQLNLTHIIKFETFDRDTSALIQKTNLSHLLPPNGKLWKLNISGHSSKSSSSSLVDSYLKELTPELLAGVRKLYEIDFDLFEYDKREDFQFI